jgi:hypothetical protein
MTKLTKHFRVQLDFTIDIDDSRIPIDMVPPARPNGGVQPRFDDEEVEREDNERNLRLLQAVMNNQEVLSTYVRYILVSKLADLGSEDLYSLLGVKHQQEEEMLAPAIQQLSRKDREEYAQGIREGWVSDSLDSFDRCFEETFDKATIIELPETREEAN